MLQLGTIPQRLIAKYASIARTGVEFLVVSAVLYLVGRFVVRPIIRRFLTHSPLDRTLVQAADKVVGLVVLLVAFGMGAGVTGIPLSGSATVLAAGTVAVGFAGQHVLSNLVAGVFLVQDPKLNVGDWIEWSENSGTIEEIGFRVTRVRTADNDTVIVPNTNLMTTAVTNHTVNDPIGLTYDFGIQYDQDVGEAINTIAAVADDHEAILDRRPPTVRVKDLADNSIILQARIWIARSDRDQRGDVRAAFVRGVHERYRAAGIDLSTQTKHDLSGRIAVETEGVDDGVVPSSNE